MKLSIIIPVYNTEKYIKQCLRSIIEQNNNNIEIIIIDDKSTDNSLNIIKETTKSIKNVTILENKINKGISYSRNRGLDIAKGEYIYFIDSDDYLNKNSIEVILNFLHIYHAFGSVMNSAFWFKMNINDRKRLVNSIINYIKKKYKVDDIYSSLLIKQRYESNKLYMMRIKYIRNILKNYQDNIEVDNIEDIKELIINI